MEEDRRSRDDSGYSCIFMRTRRRFPSSAFAGAGSTSTTVRARPRPGTDIIIDEIKRDQPLDHTKLRDETLAILPDATLPDLDPVLLGHFAAERGAQQLIARYATADILDGVRRGMQSRGRGRVPR